MRLCDLDEIKIQVKRQYEDCHGYSGNKKAIYREAILAVRSILHSAKIIDAVPVVRCKDCARCVPYKGVPFCNKWRTFPEVELDGFCSYAERKEGAG